MKQERKDAFKHYELSASAVDILVNILLDFEKEEHTNESARPSEEAA